MQDINELKIKLGAKLNSGLYNMSKIRRDTKISRHWLDGIKFDGNAPEYILVALDSYFTKMEK